MKCEKCPALKTEDYEYPETYCAIGIDDDHELATEWKDGSCGCLVHPATVKRMLQEENEAWKKQYQDIAEWYAEQAENERLGVNVSDLNGKYISLAKHCIGLDYHRPYKRHGKLFYRPYRNYYDAGGDDIAIWDTLVKIGYARKNRAYHLSDAGLRWIGKILAITICSEIK